MKMNKDPIERFELNWPGKRAAMEAACKATHAKLCPAPAESVNWTQARHLFIEGDNLDVLKLLQSDYAQRVQMIYIDPPYNTGKEFVYSDSLRKVRRGQSLHTMGQDGAQNPQMQVANGAVHNGAHHAAWLSMIYPRLVLARQLLKEDGLIFVSIDDNEVHHLRLVMDEIFGEENFVAQFVWNSSTAGGIRAKYVNRNHEYALCYARTLAQVPQLFAPLSQEAVKQYNRRDAHGRYREKDFAWVTQSNNANQRYLIECPDGTFVQPQPGYLFRYVRSRFEEARRKDLVIFKRTKTSPLMDQNGQQARWNIYIKKYLGDATGAPASLTPKSVVGLYNSGSNEIKELFGAMLFNNPKPTAYLRYFLQMAVGKNSTDVQAADDELVLDFFAGSCSTAHAVLAHNRHDGRRRRFIMVQQPEPTPPNSLARRHGFATIADLGKERIRRVLRNLAMENCEGVRVYKLESDDFAAAT
ncbi:MAG: site-specific DNA-methyltransferase [Caldilineaceae bacterium]